MAFSAVDSTSNTRSFSIGPLKMQILKWTAVSGDATGVITVDKLSRVDHIIIDGGLQLTGVPAYSGNQATLTFTAVGIATTGGTIIALGV